MAEYIFVAIPSRLGSKTLTGPKTGIRWTVKPSGSWIDKEDVELLETDIPYYCFKSRSMKVAHIYETSPSADDLLSMPS